MHGQKRKKKGKGKKGNLKIHFLPTFYRELKITRIGSEIFFSTLFGHKSRKYNRVKFRECIGGHRRISLKGTRKQRVKTNTGEEYSFRFHGAKKKKKKKKRQEQRIRAKAKRERWLDRASVGEGKRVERERERERRRDPLDTCLLSTFGSSGNKRRKAVRRQVYGHGINYRRFRTFLRKCNALHASRYNAYTHRLCRIWL